MSQGRDEKLQTVILNYMYQVTEVLCTAQFMELAFLSPRNHREFPIKGLSLGVSSSRILKAQRTRKQIEMLKKTTSKILRLPINRMTLALFLFQSQVFGRGDTQGYCY